MSHTKIGRGLKNNRCRARVVPVNLVQRHAGVDVGNLGEVADDLTIPQHAEEGLALADIAIDESGAIVVAGAAIKVQDLVPTVQKVTDDESSNPPTAAGHRDAKSFSHERDER